MGQVPSQDAPSQDAPSQDAPARCPLCSEPTRDAVTLRCGHRFCPRCLGDLWSVSPDGPFRCPQWRCPTEYRTLPFDRARIKTPCPRGQTRPGPATDSSTNGSSSDSLRRPSLTSRLLGKRKSSTPASEAPDTKRPAGGSDPEDTETPGTSSSSSSSSPSDRRGQQGTNDGTPSPAGRDQPEGPDPAAPPQDGSAQQNPGLSPPPPIILDDSDSSNEVDVCEAPLTPPKKDEKDAPTTGSHVSPRKPASPGFSDGETSPSHVGTWFTRPESRTSNPPVPCHYCPKPRCQPAVKTCLVCGASMCSEHLRPHLEAAVFQDHALVPPTEDVSLWRCPDHQEVNRIYCRTCTACVCTVCTVIGSHRDHVCISIREAERELRGNLKEEIKQLQTVEQQVRSRVTDFTEKKETFRVLLEEARGGVRQQYAAIREALEQEEQSALHCVTREESRVLGGLEAKLGHLQRALQNIQQGLHTLEGLADAKGDKRTQDQAFIMEYSRITQLTSDMGSCVEQFEEAEELDQDRLRCLQRWTEKRLDGVVITSPGKDRDLFRLRYGIIPVLDSDSAHPKLRLSDGGRAASYCDAPQPYADHAARFTSFPQVLASTRLDGGRWYWEVSVCVDDGRWKVGVCEAQMERKGQRDGARLGFNAASWCLACDRRRLEALHGKDPVPVEAGGLDRVGVFLDFDEGVLSFFNVTPGGSLTLIHSYTHRFTAPLLPAFSVSKTQLAVCDLFQS